MAGRIPSPAYPTTPQNSPILYGDKELYAKIGKISQNEDSKILVESFEVPIRSGKAWVVKKGQLCTLSTPHGPQVGDLNIFSLSNPRERFWASRTKQLHASHVSVGDRLWSCLPYMRPLATIVGDSLTDYGVDGVGGRVHDLLGTRCDPYVNKLLSGDDFDFQCHSNLVRAVLPYGLTEADIHDVINVFQVTGLNKDGKYFMEACPAKPGDYFTFFAETDLLCALSTCPGGDLSVYGWGEDSAKRMLATCRPLGVAVYEMKHREEVLKGWKESERPAYKGMHGLKTPVFGE
ncbi:Uncharacterized protein LSUE1_G005431 [Lachnellula suecica]|uniref:DUF1989 domain-containing protein n=1 Tax=Lachnellula suecica TaxID=602035 RepID=A0A8T9C9P0_9HELO|nr:Uncharacterized protein LSUE1_G005431 [Lachnellula suecica]